MSVASPARALWNQRQQLASMTGKLNRLVQAVDKPIDFNHFQWATLTAFALEFQPDLVIELGRDRGNSTCCFLEVAHRLRGIRPCRVVSLDLLDRWTTQTVPRLQSICPPEWFEPAEILHCDILQYDVTAAVAQAERCLVFWDAHGFEIADWVLGHLLPQLQSKAHVVLMHDLTDRRYCSPPREYGTPCNWKGDSPTAHHYWFGHICSCVGQAISIIDFTARNDLPLHSTDESLFTELWNDPRKLAEIQRQLGADWFAQNAHWFWFSLNEASGPLVFPRFQVQPPQPPLPADAAARLLPGALRSLSRRYPKLSSLFKRVVRPVEQR